MRQAPQEFVPAIVMNDRLRDDSAERRHTRRQPYRDTAALQGKYRSAGAACHRIENPNFSDCISPAPGGHAHHLWAAVRDHKVGAPALEWGLAVPTSLK